MINDSIFIEPVVRDSRVGEGIRRVCIEDRHTGEAAYAFISESDWATIKLYNEGLTCPH